MKTEKKTFADFAESSFAEMREVVNVAIKKGWVHFPVERSALVRRATELGWIRFSGASAPAALNPRTPAKAVKTRTRCKSALSAKRR
jgi:hypothetical protein